MDDIKTIVKIFSNMMVEDQDLFVKFLLMVCAEQVIQDKKEAASSAHPTAENTL